MKNTKSILSVAKFLPLALLMVSGQAMAGNCVGQVVAAFQARDSNFQIVNIGGGGALGPGDSRGYYNSEISNPGKTTLSVYEIKAAVPPRGQFIFVALVDEKTCTVQKFVNVYTAY